MMKWSGLSNGIMEYPCRYLGAVMVEIKEIMGILEIPFFSLSK